MKRFYKDSFAVLRSEQVRFCLFGTTVMLKPKSKCNNHDNFCQLHRRGVIVSPCVTVHWEQLKVQG